MRKGYTRTAVVAAAFMVLSSALAWAMTPTRRLVDEHGKLQLEASIPREFGEWRVDPHAAGGVVNPQQAAMLDKLYSQTLTRTYINRAGQRIMLSVAYGEDQRDGMQVHYPEVCYPAQGFELRSSSSEALALAGGGVIPVRRLETSLAGQRFEPVTYWVVIGDQAVLGGSNKKMVEMRYGLRGQIPDGLLFRVSSISRDSLAAFGVQERFITDLIEAVPLATRGRLIGTRTSDAIALTQQP